MKEAIGSRVAEVLSSGKLILGPVVESFEEQLADACGRRHAITVGSCTDALFFALQALDIGPGDEVLVPDVSFIATASAVVRTGARPVFVDVDENCHLDLNLAAELVTPRTRALMFVQLFGAMGDPDAIEAFAVRHKLAVVEDGAQGFGARFGQRRCGSVGNISALSFSPMKVLSAPGNGGAVLTDDDAYAATVRRLRYHGRESARFVELGYSSLLPSIAAAVLSLKLVEQDRWAARRTEIAQRYIKGLEGLPIELPRCVPGMHHVWHKFTVALAGRNALGASLKSAGVPTMVHYPLPLHREPLFEPWEDRAFPRACAHAARTLSLPIHAHLSDEEIKHVVSATAEYLASGT
ncbi:DegT/DnrJ/EryC1/StrS family aminotransferase [Caulobacter soli]|uniref:DegT/DnrJ/EryC1/StrS family aminotransferase n=1 Tax=Caulobacter soli TaxID=2708539 RepID=UPI0013EB94DE|nr:DegT/DnrJ/EryC1/StrS family aminotransferase [Caulobacter soli]